MEITGKLEKKAFTGEDGKSIEYYVLSIPLIDGTNMEITIKGDKAKLLLMSESLKRNK